MKLGEKIKEERLKRGLTQAALAGDTVTRNMLCQIEKGVALPSLPTLLHLADTLGVPAGYFLTEEMGVEPYLKTSLLPKIKELYSSGHYDACFRLCESLGETPDDETCLFLAECAVSAGRLALEAGNMDTAATYFKAAELYAEKTVHDTASLLAKARLLGAIASDVQMPLRHFDPESYLRLSETGDAGDWLAFLEADDTYPFREPILTLHTKGRALLKRGEHERALTCLNEVEEETENKNYNEYYRFCLYTDLEACHRERGNFEQAYRYATKRVALLGLFQS